MGYITEVFNILHPELQPGDCGHPATYQSHHCRCRACTRAHTEQHEWYKQRNYAQRRLVNGIWIAAMGRRCPDIGPVPHGTRNAYDYWGCRGNACAESHKKEMSEYHAARKHNRRILQQLQRTP